LPRRTPATSALAAARNHRRYDPHDRYGPT